MLLSVLLLLSLTPLASSLLDKGPLGDKLVKPGVWLSHQGSKVIIGIGVIIIEQGCKDEGLQFTMWGDVGMQAALKELSNDSLSSHGEPGLLKLLQEVAMDIASTGDGLLLSQTMVGSNADEEIPEMKDMEKQSITVAKLGDIREQRLPQPPVVGCMQQPHSPHKSMTSLEGCHQQR